MKNALAGLIGIVIGALMAWALIIGMFMFIDKFSNRRNPVELTQTGDYLTVRMDFYSKYYTEVIFPESEYTHHYTKTVEKKYSPAQHAEFIEYLSKQLEESFKYQNYSRSRKRLIKKTPPVEWLTQHVKIVNRQCNMAKFYLPDSGRLQVVAQEPDFKKYINTDVNILPTHKYYHMHVRINGKEIGSIEPINESSACHGQYIVVLEYIQDYAKVGKLLYQYPNREDYAIIDLPPEVFKIKDGDLDSKTFIYEWVFEIYTSK